MASSVVATLQQRQAESRSANCPLNQGGFGTCCAYGFAAALQSGLMNKYDVPVDRDELVTVVKTLCPCWEGQSVDKMVEEWNDVQTTKVSWLENIDKQKRYHVRVESQRFDDLRLARAEFCKLDGLLHFVAVIKMDAAGPHKLHAVELIRCWPDSETDMQALNSWGAMTPTIRVTPENFVYALSIGPEIVGGMEVLHLFPTAAEVLLHQVIACNNAQGAKKLPAVPLSEIFKATVAPRSASYSIAPRPGSSLITLDLFSGPIGHGSAKR
jgi:hypothetical protein